MHVHLIQQEFGKERVTLKHEERGIANSPSCLNKLSSTENSTIFGKEIGNNSHLKSNNKFRLC